MGFVEISSFTAPEFGLEGNFPQDIEMTNYVELGMRGVLPRLLRVRRSSRSCWCRLLALVFVVLFRLFCLALVSILLRAFKPVGGWHA